MSISQNNNFQCCKPKIQAKMPIVTIFLLIFFLHLTLDKQPARVNRLFWCWLSLHIDWWSYIKSPQAFPMVWPALLTATPGAHTEVPWHIIKNFLISHVILARGSVCQTDHDEMQLFSMSAFFLLCWSVRSCFCTDPESCFSHQPTWTRDVNTFFWPQQASPSWRNIQKVGVISATDSSLPWWGEILSLARGWMHNSLRAHQKRMWQGSDHSSPADQAYPQVHRLLGERKLGSR